MNKVLVDLEERIKGAKIYKNRVYIPYFLDYSPYKVKVKVYFEVVNDKLKLFVEVSTNDFSQYWCEEQEEKIKKSLHEQFYEIIYNCELTRKQTPLNERLIDNSTPIITKASFYQAEAIRFLCKIKVAALFAEEEKDRIFIALRIAYIRILEGKIKKIHVCAPIAKLASYQKEIEEFAKNIHVSVNYLGTESLSHNSEIYENALKYTDTDSMLIVDDCHMFKTPQSLRSIRMLEISKRCSYKLIMTNSPIVNNIHDVYMQYRILSDLILNYERWEDFTKMHLITGGIGGNQILGYKNLFYLASMVEPYTYAIEKTEPKAEGINTLTHICELTENQKFYYQQKKNELLFLIAKDELRIYDIFRIFIEMQKIVCGCLSEKGGRKKILKSYKPKLLIRNIEEGQCVIFCKYIFEIEDIINYLGRENCAIFTRGNRSNREKEKSLFLEKKKKYLISTLGISDMQSEDLKDCNRFIFYSLSFKYMDYRHCLSYIQESKKEQDVSVVRFVTDSGIDKKIIENLNRKGRLSNELQILMQDKRKLKSFVAEL